MNMPKHRLSVAVSGCDITTAAFILIADGTQYSIYVRKEPSGLRTYIESPSFSLIPFESFIKSNELFYKEMEQKAVEKAKDMFARTDTSLVMTLHDGYSLLAATFLRGKSDYGWLDMMKGDQLFHYVWKADGNMIKVTLAESIGAAAEPRFVKEEILSLLSDLVARSLFRYDKKGTAEPLYTLSGTHEIAKETQKMKKEQKKTIIGTSGKGMGGDGAERTRLVKELQKSNKTNEPKKSSRK